MFVQLRKIQGIKTKINHPPVAPGSNTPFLSQKSEFLSHQWEVTGKGCIQIHSIGSKFLCISFTILQVETKSNINSKQSSRSVAKNHFRKSLTYIEVEVIQK